MFGKRNKLSSMRVKTPSELLVDALRTASGSADNVHRLKDIFYKVIGFKGVKDGVGCSVIVANTAVALGKLGYKVCVLDTSILNPCQDILLKAREWEVQLEKEDWFDWGTATNKSILRISSLNNNVSILSFYRRQIVDLCSNMDSTDLVKSTVTKLSTLFDFVLIDICGEPSAVAFKALHVSNKIIQIWEQAPHSIRSIDSSITNNTICSCPIDKTRHIIINKVLRDMPVPWDKITKRYRFDVLAEIPFSSEIAHYVAANKIMFNAASNHVDIECFTQAIVAVCNLLINPEQSPDRGTNILIDGREGEINEISPDLKEDFEEVKKNFFGAESDVEYKDESAENIEVTSEEVVETLETK